MKLIFNFLGTILSSLIIIYFILKLFKHKLCESYLTEKGIAKLNEFLSLGDKVFNFFKNFICEFIDYCRGVEEKPQITYHQPVINSDIGNIQRILNNELKNIFDSILIDINFSEQHPNYVKYACKVIERNSSSLISELDIQEMISNRLVRFITENFINMQQFNTECLKCKYSRTRKVLDIYIASAIEGIDELNSLFHNASFNEHQEIDIFSEEWNDEN